MANFSAFREFSSGYLFMLDLFMVLALLSLLLHKGNTERGLYVALVVYLTGHGIERLWIWNWWGGKEGTSTIWGDLTLARYDPTLMLSLTLVSIGLTACVFILANNWGRWAWVICVAIAVFVPTMFLFY